MYQEEMRCPKCGCNMKEYVTRFLCRNQSCHYEFTKYFPGGTDDNRLCTRPDIVDCHAGGGPGGICMNGVRCPPLEGKQIKKNTFEQYERFGKKLWGFTHLKGKHKEYCLCYGCAKFSFNHEENCKKANLLYATDIALSLTTPVFECVDFQQK